MSFKIIIAGGRDCTNYSLVKATLDKLLKNRKDIEIVSGVCNTGKLTFNRPDGTIVCGADGLGERYADEKGIPVTPFPAQWDTYGKSAGYKRNEVMAKYANALVAFWDGQSRGTGHMIDLAKKHGLQGKVVNY